MLILLDILFYYVCLYCFNLLYVEIEFLMLSVL